MMQSITKFACAVVLGVALAALASADGWLTSYRDALQMSKKTGKPVLVDFTGSDWCSWCVRLHKEVFDTPSFRKWAAKNVVLLELDFPERHRQPQALAEQNEALRTKYGPRGFPTIYFLNSDGKAFGTYGYDRGGPEHWTQMADRVLKPRAPAAR